MPTSPLLPVPPQILASALRSGASGAPLRFAVALACCLSLAMATAAGAAISGTVVDEVSGDPVGGATVRIQAESSSVITAGDGSFILDPVPAGFVTLTAAVPYDAGAGVNFIIGSAFASDGNTGVTISLPRLPTADNPTYAPPTSAVCAGCHSQQVAQWQGSPHSNAARDEWVLDLYSGTGTAGGSAGYVFLDTHDPGETGFCSACHTPLAEAMDPGNVFLDQVTDPGALDGVGCLACHQIDSVDGDVNALHVLGNATYRFPQGDAFTPTWQYVWGPLDDVSFGGMRPSHAPFFSDPLFCATCHQYNNPDTGAPGQNTYGEWLASPYSTPGPDFRTCQGCHMPAGSGSGEICDIGGSPTRPPLQRASHAFEEVTPLSLSFSVLLDTAAVDANGQVTVTAAVTNAGAGHNFPTGVSIRNAMVVLDARYGGLPLPQVAGDVLPFWASDDVPGDQPGDYAGQPGKGFAKILEGRINGQGPIVRPVLFIDAEGVWEDTLIPANATDTANAVFQLPPNALPGETVEVSARLLYRRAFRALAVTKGWTTTPSGGPIEIEIAEDLFAHTLVVGGVPELSPVEIPTLSHRGMIISALLLALTAGIHLRRRRALRDAASPR
ncbi:MAG: IPTL-CTERM sorting domain-containing protein [Acidobacteriota bacterium]